MTSATSTLTGERADLLEALAAHRHFLRFTVQGLTDEQARQRTTASELTLGGLAPGAGGLPWGGLVKPGASPGAGWGAFVLGGRGVMPAPDDPEQRGKWAEESGMGPDETLGGILARYEEVARRTDELVRTLP